MRFRFTAQSVCLEIDDSDAPPDSVPPPRGEARAKRLPLRPVIDTEGAEVIQLDARREVSRG